MINPRQFSRGIRKEAVCRSTKTKYKLLLGPFGASKADESAISLKFQSVFFFLFYRSGKLATGIRMSSGIAFELLAHQKSIKMLFFYFSTNSLDNY
jgi:hypothetical protein